LVSALTTRYSDVDYEAEPEGIRTLLEKLYGLQAITDGSLNISSGD